MTNDCSNSNEAFLHPSSPKVIALYDAVTALSGEGADLTRLKVSDIAAKAGIGKGTTYEYFKSREELIVKAVLYNIYHHIQVIQRRMQQEEDFRSKIDIMLDTLFQTGGSDISIFQQFMLIFREMESLPDRFREEFVKCTCGMKVIEKMFEEFLADARKEGIVRAEPNLFYVRNAFINIIMDYAFYKKQSVCKNSSFHVTEEAFRKRLYENLVYMLRE